MKKKFKISFEVVKEVETNGPEKEELKQDEGIFKRIGTSFLSGIFSGLGRLLVTGTCIPWEYLIQLYHSLFG